MKSICLSTAYLAPIEYYMALYEADTIQLEQHEYYEKQSYRNRCNIAAANGQMALTIPIEKLGGVKILTRDIRISEHNDWQIHHWRSIESAYNSTPFFEYYKDDFQPFYEKKWTFLWDFNQEIQVKALELLDFKPITILTEEYKTKIDDNILDLRNSIHPKKENSIIHFKTYYQVFEQKFGFISNLSIIDLLFNMGNEAQLIIVA
jgi:hypothetical protein